ARRSECDQRVATPDREDHSNPAADRGNDETFEQELADDLAAAGPQGRANGELPGASGPPRGQEVRQIRASDQQNDSDRAEEQGQAGPVITEKIIEERLYRDAGARVRGRIKFLETRRDG